MSETLRWWLVLQVIALPLLPLCLWAFRRLPDRGYALSKPFGLLFLGFTFWFFNSLRIIPNSGGGIVGAMLLLMAVSVAFAWPRRDDLRAWVERNWDYALAVEALLFVAFVVAVWLRAHVPDILGTEQPMDLMYLNATTQADHFPPQDPWLSGYSVAYYYFGYLIVGMVARMADVPTEVAYNIGLGMIAALTVTAAAGLAYNLVQMRRGMRGGDGPKEPRAGRSLNWRAAACGIGAAFALVAMGNLAWSLYTASAYGLGSSGFYNWLDIQGLTADEPRNGWYPSQFFAFFGTTRVVPLDNIGGWAITEFPMFSFVLGDLHPHVMALPFVLLVVGAALSLYRSEEPLDITFWLQRPLLLVAVAIMLGGLAFLNTWDIATMSFVLALAALASNYSRMRAVTTDLFVQTATFIVPLLVLAALFYLPFYTSFSSQADGIAAVVTRPGVTEAGTRPVHLFIFWAPLAVLALPYLAMRLSEQRARITRSLVAACAAVPVAVVVAWAVVFAFTKARGGPHVEGAGSLVSQIGDRGVGWISVLILAAVLTAALLSLYLELTRAPDDRGQDSRGAAIFGDVLLTTAALLVLGCEFLYVTDVFYSRMNTMFKLYYQAWLLLSLVAGLAVYELIFNRERLPRRWQFSWAASAAVIVGLAALFPLGGTMNRVSPEEGAPFWRNGRLNGIAYYDRDERAAIEWLRQQARGQDVVIAEAVGNDYSYAARISAATGVPAILGWGGHEDQWRGDNGKARAGRFEDVTELYTTPDLQRAESIAAKYGVTYIYVGPFEREQYSQGLDKFTQLPVAFQSGGVTVYRTGGAEAQAAR